MAPRLIQAARAAEARLAGRDTPFLFEAWYIAGFAEDFSRAWPSGCTISES